MALEFFKENILESAICYILSIICRSPLIAFRFLPRSFSLWSTIKLLFSLNNEREKSQIRWHTPPEYPLLRYTPPVYPRNCLTDELKHYINSDAGFTRNLSAPTIPTIGDYNGQWKSSPLPAGLVTVLISSRRDAATEICFVFNWRWGLFSETKPYGKENFAAGM